MSAPRTRRRLGGLAAALLVASATALAQLPKAGDKPPPGGDPADDILSDLDAAKAAADLHGLRDSHLSLVETWRHVEPAGGRPKDATLDYHWKAAGGYATPATAQPISTLVEVPKDGEYRLYLRHRLGQQRASPVALRVEPLRAADPARAEYAGAGPATVHTFGDMKLLPNTLGKEQEKKLAVRFESAVQLNSFADEFMYVWEYRDVKLTKGPHRLSLQSDRHDARVSAVFLTRSKAFRPSLSEVKKDNTLEGVYIRYRVVKGATAPEFGVSTGITYHWPGRRAPTRRSRSGTTARPRSPRCPRRSGRRSWTSASRWFPAAAHGPRGARSSRASAPGRSRCSSRGRRTRPRWRTRCRRP